MKSSFTLDSSLMQNRGVFDDEHMRRMRQARVLIAGLGGLGGHVAIAFARAGVSALALVDFDRFEASNLNRQALCDTTTLNRPKVDVFARALKNIRPHLNIEAYEQRIETLESAVYERSDLIVDCLDNIASKRHLEQCAADHRKPFLHGALGGVYGQYGLFTPGNGVLKELYGAREAGIEITAKCPTFTPGVLAHLMVTQGLFYLAGAPSAPINTLRVVDLHEHTIHVIYRRHKETADD